MIFADKLISLRKKAGWSQEELAEKLDVSRQSVSKWEGAQSIPELGKILQLSELFGVSTDYLLKDEIEYSGDLCTDAEESGIRRVSMEEASAFLTAKEETAKPTALATFLCILSPICILILGAMSEVPKYGISESLAAAVGMITMLLLIAGAVAVFITCGNRISEYAYLEKELFETAYGVRGMVKQRKSEFKPKYLRSNIIGSSLCISAMIPFFAGVGINEENDLFMIIMLCISILTAGVGVLFFVSAGVIWGSYERLLQEGDYSKEKKARNSLASAVYITYWMLATAVFFIASYSSDLNWKYSWIVWVVAGVLFPAVVAITTELTKHKDK